ncbi:hypothetical protein [Verrucomicrobium spinosum]|uniref:hypothetical protein n=1 Tax=Verrucomicrobium spinosum TaxID=2736 RepID=UPI000A9142D0|nr:hypothetical protein [Verrucomicrobium spinosum]
MKSFSIDFCVTSQVAPLTESDLATLGRHSHIPKLLRELLAKNGVGSFNSSVFLVRPCDYLVSYHLQQSTYELPEGLSISENVAGIVVAKNDVGDIAIVGGDCGRRIFVQFARRSQLVDCNDDIFGAIRMLLFGCGEKFGEGTDVVYFSSALDTVMSVGAFSESEKAANVIEDINNLQPDVTFSDRGTRCFYFRNREVLVSFGNYEEHFKNRAAPIQVQIILNPKVVDLQDRFWVMLQKFVQRGREESENQI